MLATERVNTINGNMYIYSDDPTIGRSLKHYGEYCQPEVDLIIEHTDHNSFVLDIGANIGTHCIPVSKHVKRVVAFEPDEQNFDLLLKNCAETGCTNITPNRLGIGSDTYRGGTRFDFGKTQLTGGNDITITSLDNIRGFPSVDFVKIDVEGMEPDVLEGASGTIAYYKPSILIEMQQTQHYQTVFDFLTKHQYNIYWFLVATYNPSNHKKYNTDIFGKQHGVINWFATQKTTQLQPVVDRDDTVERMVYRSDS